jgi:hypothetical protein
LRSKCWIMHIHQHSIFTPQLSDTTIATGNSLSASPAWF